MRKTVRYAAKYMLVLSLAVFAVPAMAQDAEEEEEIILGKWYNGLTARVSGGQVGFSNWAGGGVNSTSISAGILGGAEKTVASIKQTHSIKLGLGGISQSGEELRKAEDVIDIQTVWEYLGQGFFEKWHPTFAATALTQFIDGFTYNDDDSASKVSDLFSPLYLTQSVGLSRDITPFLKQRFGFAAKETVVSDETLRAVYGNDIDETIRVEAGIESRTDFEKEIVPNVTYRSSLGIFAAFQNIDKPDISWENLISMKVNDWLNVNFELVTLYDEDVTSDLQLREVLSVGATFLLL